MIKDDFGQTTAILLIKPGWSFFSRSSIVVDDNKSIHCRLSDSICRCIGQGLSALHLRKRSAQVLNSSFSPVISTSLNNGVAMVFSFTENPP